MNAPPPYYAPGPKKTNVGLIVAIVVGAIALCCIAPVVFFGIIGKGVFNKAVGLIGCGWQIAGMRDGLLAYAKDHGDKLPGKDHWQDDIAKYLKPPPTNNGIQYPEQNGDACDVQSVTSVTFNEALAGKKLASISDPDHTILLWESAGKGRNQSAKYSRPDDAHGPSFMVNVPRGWIQQPVYGSAFFSDQKGRHQPVPQDQSDNSSIRISSGGGSSSRTDDSKSGD